ncbi:hypothetical protein SAMN05518672_11518 [Chitinophaga sp. CF118]|uniref:DUF6603 domain-containing protein n=1 Tax=Chitinophaga sp. CF118 TaxID=1884367 RepID=UPI0008E3FC8B|nr:DUF6603 domain-containing protein [Chitinophaga sp. CF118]SFF06147.1 hypothetical protein SAMN05518672_11518 [Chitinophaga sp. CF118]
MPNTDTIVSFAEIARQIQSKQDIDISESLIGTHALNSFQRELLIKDGTLQNCESLYQSDDCIYLSGTVKNLLSYPDVKVNILIFDTGKTGKIKRNVLGFFNFPSFLTPDLLLQQFTSVKNVQDIFASGKSSFLTAKFSDALKPVLLYSSTDSLPAFTNYPEELNKIMPWAKVKAGITCKIDASLDTSIASIVSMLSIPTSMGMELNILRDQNKLSLAYPLDVSKKFGPFSLGIKDFRVIYNLSQLGKTIPFAGVSGHIDFGIGSSDVFAYVDITKKEFRFRAEDIHFSLDSLDSFTNDFAGGSISDLMPGSIADYGTFFATYFQAVISLKDGHIKQTEFQLTTEKPINFIDGAIALTPYFNFNVQEPFNKDERDTSIEFGGEWQLGTSFFDLVVLPDFSGPKTDFNISGSLRPGNVLDIGALTDKIIGKDIIPSGLAIADLEFEASVNKKSLDISLDVLSDWELKLGGATFAIQEVDLALVYADKHVKECSVHGRVELFSLGLDISGEYDKEQGWVISGGLAPDERLVISTLLVNIISTFQSTKSTDLMDSVKLLLGDMTVRSLIIVYAVNQSSLSVFVELDNVLSFPCLSINKVIAKVDVTDSVLTGNCLVNLTIGGVDIFLNTEKKKDGLIFTGGLPANTTLPAGKLMDDLFSKFTGAGLPEFLSGIEVTALNILYNTATKDYAFSIKGTMKIGSSKPVISFDTSMIHGKDESYTKKINAVIVANTSLADMAESFGFNGSALPGILKGLIFSGINFSYDSTIGITKYSGGGEINIEGQTVQLKLDVNQSKKTAAYSGNFTWLPDTGNKNSGLDFQLKSVKDSSSSSLDLSLVFTIKGVKIDLKASSSEKEEKGVKISNKQFKGSTSNLNLSVTDVLDDLLKYIYPDYKDVIPAAFIPDIIIKDVFITYDGSIKQTNLAAIVTVSGKEIKIFFQYQSKSDSVPESRYAFGIEADIASLDGMPLIGSELKDVSLKNTGFAYTSGAGEFFIPAITTSAGKSNLVIPKAGKKFSKGFNLIGEINIPGQQPFQLTLPPKGLKASVPATLSAADSEATVKWFDIGKKLGPVTVGKLGFAYNLRNSKKISLLIDGNVAAGGLDLSLNGMGVSILPGDLFKGNTDSLSFELSGIGLKFEKGPVEISASFIRTTQKVNGADIDVYNGGVILKMKQFMITGIGSYAKVGNNASLFIYGLYEGNIGGPSFFFVTGIAAGFGYNRRVNIPSINEVHKFPLVAMAMQPDKSKGIIDILKDLETKDSTGKLPIEIAMGEYWLAVGIKFTSFKIVESFVLLTVNFGTDVEFAILGLSRLKWPEKSIAPSPIVYIELAVLAHFGPGSDVISVEAIITPNSYLFSKDCTLTGGFAFYTWISGRHEGDFVVTLGGYHPKFKKPDHYPTVPRLAIAWKVSDVLSIRGEMYYALTPTAIMAGGRMEVLFQIPVLSASLTIWADMLISWSPFQYYIDMGICVKIDAHISISFISIHFCLEMDAELHIWGPPFAGEAYVDWTIFSFTIPFGASDKTLPAPLEWKQFAGTYIPPNPVNTVINKGIIKQVKDPADNQKIKYTIINPHELELTIDSLIPATSLLVNGAEADDTIPMRSGTGNTILKNGIAVNNTYAERKKELGIRPCGLSGNDGLDFSLNVTVTLGKVEQMMSVSCIAKGATDALWGSEISTSGNQNPGTSKVIENVLSGLTLRPPAKQNVSSIRELDFSQLFDMSGTMFVWNQQMAETARAYHSYDVFETIQATYVKDAVTKERNRLMEMLSMVTGEVFQTDVTDMNTIMTGPQVYFKAPPVLCQAGQIPQYPTDTQ